MKRVLVYIFALLFLVPLTWDIAGLRRLKSLNWVEEKVDGPSFGYQEWFSGDFQQQFEKYFSQSWALRPHFIRLRNQLFYSLFNESTTYIIPDKDNQLYSYEYFAAYKGFDLKKETLWEDQMNKLAKVRDTLAHHGIPLLVVLAPNKTRYYIDDYSAMRKAGEGKKTNQRLMLDLAKKYQIEVLDLNQWFVDKKDSLPYAPFPKTGSHWNAYGASIGASKIHQWLKKTLADSILPGFKLQAGGLKDSIIESDNDLALGLNLICTPKTEKQYFFEFDLDTVDKGKPNILTIGDSYFWTINSVGYNKLVYSRASSFWYYNKTCYDFKHDIKPVEELKFWDEILDRDAVILISTESNLHRFPFGFPETVFKDNS